MFKDYSSKINDEVSLFINQVSKHTYLSKLEFIFVTLSLFVRSHNRTQFLFPLSPLSHHLFPAVRSYHHTQFLLPRPSLLSLCWEAITVPFSLCSAVEDQALANPRLSDHSTCRTTEDLRFFFIRFGRSGWPRP